MEQQSEQVFDQKISEPDKLQQQDANFKQKTSEGLIKVYQCQYCGRKFKVHKKRAMMHKSVCERRKQMKKITQNREEQEYFQQQLQQANDRQLKELGKYTHEGQLGKMKLQIQDLKNKMNIALNHTGHNYFQSDRMAQLISEQVWNDVSLVVVPLVKEKLKQQISIAMSNKIDVKGIISSLRANLISRFYEFDFRDLLLSWSHKLQDACDQLIVANSDKSRETQSRDKTAAQELLKYSQFQLTGSHRQFIISLKTMTKYKRSNIIRFYSKIIHKFPNLKLKMLPLNLPVYVFSFQRKIIDLQTIKNKTVELWNQHQRKLACDLYFCVCLGLRRSELLRVQLTNQNGFLYRSIKIYQRKNKHLTMRPIPITLHLLANLSKTMYPITSQRFSKVRDFCLKQFSQFYGLRHVCITNLITAVLNNADLAFHRKNKTTITRYLNLQTIELVDKTFHINQFSNFLKAFSFQWSNKLPFFKQGDQVQFLQLQEKTQITLLEDADQEYLNDENYDCILSGSIDKDYEKSSQITEREKQQIKLKSNLFNTFHQELEQEKFTSIQALNFIIKQSKISPQQIEEVAAQTSRPPTFKSKLQVISELLQIQIVPIQYNNSGIEDFSDSLHKQSGNEKSKIGKSILTQPIQAELKQEKPVLLVAKIGKDIMISQAIKEVASISALRRSPRLRKVKSSSRYLFMAGDAYCHKCLFYFESLHHNNTSFLFCKNCGYDTRNANRHKVFRSNNIVEYKLLSFQSDRVYSKVTHRSIRKTDKENNFVSTVQQQYGKGSFCSYLWYSQQIPQMTSNMVCHSSITNREILYNKQNQRFLPLQIRRSTIESAGRGLFATANLPANSLILTYAAVIRSIHTIDVRNDSSFEIGFADPQQEGDLPIPIFLQPGPKTNAARYINHGSIETRANSSCFTGLAVNKEGDLEICVYVYSTRTIERDQEILYDYGSHYQFKLFQSNQNSSACLE